MPDVRTKWLDERPFTTEPPPARTPRAIGPHTVTHGHRLVTVVADGYRRDLRGYGNPYYRHVPSSRRWEVDDVPPDGLCLDDKDVTLVVDVCNEAAWYAWGREGRDPAEHRGTFPVTAKLTWIE
jgi:hypothetical protein